MNLEKIIKYQAGWNYQKGRWNTYPNDMMGLDTACVQLPNGGPKVGLALPTQVFCRDQRETYCSDFEQDIRSKWESAGCLYSYPFVINGIKFFDIKTHTYRLATIHSKTWIINPEAIDKPSYTDPIKPIHPYAVGTFITDDEGNEYCIHHKGYFAWSSAFPSYEPQYDTYNPQYDFYLSGGYARNTWTGGNAVYFAPVIAFCPPSRSTARYSYIGFCDRIGVEAARSYMFNYGYWEGWGLGGLGIPHNYSSVTRGSMGGYEVLDGVPPYGFRLYNENEETGFLCPAEYSYFIEAPSDFCSAGYVWYGDSAGVLSPTEDTNVDIDI